MKAICFFSPVFVKAVEASAPDRAVLVDPQMQPRAVKDVAEGIR